MKKLIFTLSFLVIFFFIFNSVLSQCTWPEQKCVDYDARRREECDMSGNWVLYGYCESGYHCIDTGTYTACEETIIVSIDSTPTTTTTIPTTPSGGAGVGGVRGGSVSEGGGEAAVTAKTVSLVQCCPIKDREITDETKWGLGGGQWKILCPSCGQYELAKEPYFEITETHWKCLHFCCERCVESGAGITHCSCEESISTQEECDALLDTSKIWYNWRQCNHIWEKQGEWIANWVSEGCYLYGREDNGGWGSVALSQNTQITPYPKENQRIYVKFKVGQVEIHGPVLDFTRLADTGIWLWMDFSEPQTVNSVEISGVELSIYLDFESANPLILPGAFDYQIRSETGQGNWLQVVWYYSKGLSDEGWIEGVIDLEPALDYIENMGVNLQQTNIYRVQALLEAHYGTAEVWYDYLDYCYWVECNPDGTNPNGLCDYRCGADPECDEKEPGTEGCTNECTFSECPYECLCSCKWDPESREYFCSCPSGYTYQSGYACTGYGTGSCSSIYEMCCKPLTSSTTTTIPSECPGDLNDDNFVDELDLNIPALVLGSSNPGADVNEDGIVDIADVIYVAIHFGNVC